MLPIANANKRNVRIEDGITLAEITETRMKELIMAPIYVIARSLEYKIKSKLSICCAAFHRNHQ